MKRILSIIIGLLAVVGAYAADGEAKVKFVDKVHDFGTINEGSGPVTCEFEYVNEGDAPLIIISAAAGCGCTHPEYDPAPIAPGAKGVIKVTYNPVGRPGEFKKNINVRTNDRKHKKIVLQIAGVVVPN